MSNPFLETQYVCNNLLYQINGDVYMMYKGTSTNTLCCRSSRTVEGRREPRGVCSDLFKEAKLHMMTYLFVSEMRINLG